MMMPEAFIEPWQLYEDDGVQRPKILVGALTDLQINLVTSQPLLQGMCANIPLSKVAVEMYNLSARHL
jgi:hypothetical protein